MADDRESARSFFEPPEWWKKWRPLRWILAALVLYWVYTLLPQPEDSPAPANTAPEQKVAAEPSAPVSPSQSKAEATPAPPTVQNAVPAAIEPKPAQPTATPPAVTPPTTPVIPKPQAVPAPVVIAPAPVAATPPAPAKPVEMARAPVKTTPVKPQAAPVQPAPVVVPPAPRPQSAAPAPAVQKPVQKPVPQEKPAPVPPAAQKQPSAGSAMVDTLPESASASTEKADAERATALAPYTTVAKDTVALMNGIRSYSSVQAVTAQLKQHGYTWKADQIVKPSRRTYPPYRTDTLTVADYRHLGKTGTLTLEFFNDRLYETNFAPVEAGDYLRLLRNQGVPLRRRESGRSELTQGNLVMESNIDFASSDVGKAMRVTPYLFWRDARLMRQVRDWGPLP